MGVGEEGVVEGGGREAPGRRGRGGWCGGAGAARRGAAWLWRVAWRAWASSPLASSAWLFSANSLAALWMSAAPMPTSVPMPLPHLRPSPASPCAPALASRISCSADCSWRVASLASSAAPASFEGGAPASAAPAFPWLASPHRRARLQRTDLSAELHQDVARVHRARGVQPRFARKRRAGA